MEVVNNRLNRVFKVSRDAGESLGQCASESTKMSLEDRLDSSAICPEENLPTTMMPSNP